MGKIAKYLTFNLSDPMQEKAVAFLDIFQRKQAVFISQLIEQMLDKNGIKTLEDVQKLSKAQAERMVNANVQQGIVIKEDSTSNQMLMGLIASLTAVINKQGVTLPEDIKSFPVKEQIPTVGKSTPNDTAIEHENNNEIGLTNEEAQNAMALVNVFGQQ